MWSQIVAGMILLVVVTYAIQFFLPRQKTNSSNANARWDIAPMLGFFSFLLLALSLVEAIRRSVLEAWALGLAVGLILSVGIWIVFANRAIIILPKSNSALVATYRLVRAFGVPVIVLVVGIYIAVRVFGSGLEVFLAGAGGIVLMTVALRIFMNAKKILVN